MVQEDHAQYLAARIKQLDDDPRAIVEAAGHASAAVNHLTALVRTRRAERTAAVLGQPDAAPRPAAPAPDLPPVPIPAMPTGGAGGQLTLGFRPRRRGDPFRTRVPRVRDEGREGVSVANGTMGGYDAEHEQARTAAAATASAGRIRDEGDVEILAAEVHGFREATAAEIRGLRESTKADVEVLAAEIQGFREATAAEIRGLREATDARLDAQDRTLERIERQIERMAADHRATVRWIVGAALALGALMMAMLEFGQTGGG